MTLKGQIRDDMKTAMKAGDKDRLGVVRMLLAAIKQVEVDQRIELTDADIVSVINKMVKQRRDSATQFSAGGRQDLVQRELAEIAVLDAYLPQPLSHSELDALVDQVVREAAATSLKEMGKVMALVKQRAQGRVDMAEVGARVKARLAH